MNLYARLYESTLDYCERSWFRPGLVYTVAMLALGLGFALNLLTAINALWTLRLLHDPYGRGGSVHPEHYVYALVYLGFLAVSIPARLKFSADRRCLSLMSEMTPPEMPARAAPSVLTSGPAYVLSSVVVFVVTLTLGLLTHR